MRARDVIGKKIVAVEQTRDVSTAGAYMRLEALELEDGTRIYFTCHELENDGPQVEGRVRLP